MSNRAGLSVDNQNVINALRLLQVHLIQHNLVNRRNIGKADIAMQKRGNRLFIGRIQRGGRRPPTSNASIASFRHGYRV